MGASKSNVWMSCITILEFGMDVKGVPWDYTTSSGITKRVEFLKGLATHTPRLSGTLYKKSPLYMGDKLFDIVAQGITYEEFRPKAGTILDQLKTFVSKSR